MKRLLTRTWPALAFTVFMTIAAILTGYAWWDAILIFFCYLAMIGVALFRAELIERHNDQ